MKLLHLNQHQEKHLEAIFMQFYKNAIDFEHENFDGAFKMQLSMVKGMIDDGIPFDQAEVNFLIFALDWYFGTYAPDHVDPLAEQAYHKLTGEWPNQFPEPWYDRVKSLGTPESGHTPKEDLT